MSELADITQKLVAALLRLDTERVRRLLAELPAREGGLVPLEAVVTPALERIGRDWEEGRASLAQIYMAGRICERVVEGMLPAHRPNPGSRPRLAIGVLEDHHALGKRMVKSALHCAGYHLLDYGHGLSAAELVERALGDRIDVLLVSCLMLASAIRARQVVQGLNQAGSRTVVVVGGAPFRLEPGLWQEVGAQAMGTNSAEAVTIVQTLAKERGWQ